MEKRRKSDAKDKKLNIKGKTGKEVDRKICRTMQNRRGSIKKYSEVEIAGLYEDSPDGKC